MSIRDNRTPFISVIIPVWNPGPGISRCIDSLRNQTLKEIEMIFVDDLGTDDSMGKIHAAAIDDTRIRIIENEENIGPGPSRNKGIEVARGEYLSFVDPDDYVAPDFLELLYVETQEQTFDIVKGSIVRERMDGSVMEYGEKTNHIIRRRSSMGTPLFCSFTYEHQSAIYRRELICSENMKYGLSRRGEDTAFLLQVCFKAKSFSTVDAAHYHYCERSGATMHVENSDMLRAMLQSVHEQVDFVINRMPEDDWVRKCMVHRFLFTMKELERFCYNSSIKTSLSNTVEGIRMEWMRLPFHSDMARKTFPLYALQEQSYLLPLEPFYYYTWESPNPPLRYAKLVERWVDYYLNNPKESNACQKDLLSVIVRAKKAVRGQPYTTYSTEERKQGGVFLKLQLKRLPSFLRVQIGYACSKSFLVSLLPKRFIQRVKKIRDH